MFLHRHNVQGDERYIWGCLTGEQHENVCSVAWAQESAFIISALRNNLQGGEKVIRKIDLS